MLVLLCLLQILPQQLERLRPVIAELRQRLPECVDAGLRQPPLFPVDARQILCHGAAGRALRPDQLQMGFLKVLKGSYMEEQVAAYDLRYRGIPPYEVLSTKWLPYSDVIRLKGVEDMVEVYYNSGQFPATMKLLEKKFARPSEIFTSLAEYYEKNGLTGISHSRLARYEILYRFLEEKEVKVEQSTPAAEEPAGMEQKTGAKAAETAVKLTLADFRDSLMYDLYVRENIKSRPSFASDQSPYKKEVREFFMAEEESPQWLTDYAGFDSKQMAKMAHLEHMEDGTFVLFDYKKRDPLSGNARAVRFVYDPDEKRMTKVEEWLLYTGRNFLN